MKKLILLLLVFSAATSSAQIKVKINGKAIAENTTIKAEDIKAFEVAFDKPKKLSYIGTGRAILGVAILNKDSSQLIEEYIIKKNGTNAVESFLGDVNVYYNVLAPLNGENFMPRIAGYDFAGMLGRDDDEVVTVEINLMFFDKIGYEKFGEPISLVKKFVFTIDNKTNAVAYAQKEQERKDREAAAQAERDKARKVEAVEAEAKKKKKGIIGGLLNKF